MNHIKRLFSVLLLSFAFVSMLSAKGVSVPAVYIFGMSFSFNDSTVYFTEIQKIENAWLIDKGKMLEGRSAYAAQLRNYFQQSRSERPDLHHLLCLERESHSEAVFQGARPLYQPQKAPQGQL